MSENHEEILANFQSITAIEDVAEAIYHLEETNWDLLTAVHRVLPQDSVPVYSGYPQINTVDVMNDFDALANVDVLMTAPSSPARATTHRNIYGADPSSSENHMIPTDGSGDYNNGSSSSSGGPSNIRHKIRNVTFNIHFKYNIHKIVISDQATVGDLKTKIMDITSVPICRQALRGWVSREESCNNATILDTLNVARENELILTDLSDEGLMEDENDIVPRLNETFTLNIVRQPEGTNISLKFPGKRTLLEVKADVFSITNIAVRHQEWSGWPSDIQNHTTLAQSGIDLVHNCVIRSSYVSLNRTSSIRSAQISNVIEIDSSDSSVDEFEDASDFNADDDLFADTTIQNRLNYLIQDEINDEKIGSVQFVENYIQRYGEPHPLFFQGNLEEALNAACHKPAKDRKLLAIYLHHDGSVLTNVFCDQLLKCETIMQTLHHNFVLYGWDLTYESNKNMFLSSIASCGGMTATITVRNIPLQQLPAILIIGKSRSTCEVLSVIHGNVGKDELLNKLIDTINMYSDQRDIEVREENERAAREQVKMEQDEAYNESLEADRRKEEAKRQKEHALATEKKRLESERQEIEAIREANRLEAEKCVPPEPEVGSKNITKIRVRKPTGDFLERRFSINSKLQVLLKFVASKGFPIDEYKVISSYPRRDLTTVNNEDTLEHLKLYPQETVTLEER